MIDAYHESQTHIAGLCGVSQCNMQDARTSGIWSIMRLGSVVDASVFETRVISNHTEPVLHDKLSYGKSHSLPRKHLEHLANRLSFFKLPWPHFVESRATLLPLAFKRLFEPGYKIRITSFTTLLSFHELSQLIITCVGHDCPMLISCPQ